MSKVESNWFNEQKGFGFISQDDGRGFIRWHFSSIKQEGSRF